MYRDAPVHVVIPAYNVASQIADVLKGLPAFVDRIVIVRNSVNEGVGGATVRGFYEALRHPPGVVVKIDGDGQMDRSYLPHVLDPIMEGRCHYAKGNRFLFKGKLDAMPRARLVGNFVLTFLTKLASGYWNVFDPQNGYLAIHTDVLRALDLERISKRYFFENDMLINLNILDVRVLDVPIPARYGGERSSMSLTKVLCSFPFHLFRGYWYRFYQKHVLRDFSPVALFMLTGLPLLAFGIFFGAYTWLQSYLRNQFASPGTVMLSVLPFLVGFELVLQALVLEIRDTPRRGAAAMPEGPRRLLTKIARDPDADESG